MHSKGRHEALALGWTSQRECNSTVPSFPSGLCLQAGAKAKFDETVEVHIKLGVDPKRSDMVRSPLNTA